MCASVELNVNYWFLALLRTYVHLYGDRVPGLAFNTGSPGGAVANPVMLQARENTVCVPSLSQTLLLRFSPHLPHQL